MSDDIDGFMRAAFLVELLGVPLVRSRFAGLVVFIASARGLFECIG